MHLQAIFSESEGKISPNEARFGDNLYIWHGNQDEVVLPLSATHSQTFWRQFAPQTSLKMDTAIPANHGLSTSLTDNATQCGIENTFAFVEKCNVSTVNRMLNHLFGTLLTTADSVSVGQLMGKT